MPIDVATGAVHFDTEDFRIPGRFPLLWARKFHSGLADHTEGPFGPGWTNDCFVKLTRIGKDYHFIGPSGFLSRFEDPGDTVERAGLIRSPGGFQEIQRVGSYLQVTKWSADGEIQRFQFFPDRNGQWWPLRILEDDKGNGLELAWDEQGRLKGVRQKHEKRTLAIQYSPAGRIASVSFRYPDGRLLPVAQYAYDARGRLVSAQDAMGHAERYEYDAEGRLTRELAKDGGIFSYRYDEKGRCIRSGGIDNYDLKSLRYLDTARMTEVTNSLGKTTRYQYLASGQITLKLDPLGGKTETAYDEFGRILSKTGPLGETTSYEYDAEGNRSKLIDALGNVSEFKYNRRHQPVEFIGPDGNGWKKEYDDRGRPIKALDALGNESGIEYDNAGNPTLLKKADGAVSRRIYSETGDLIESTDWAGKKTQYARDELGRMIQRIDPNGRIVLRKYDALGRIIECSYGDGKKVGYAYDVGGNLVKVTSTAESPVLYKYGACRRLLEKSFGNGLVRRYSWGSEPDRLERVTNELGEKYEFRYDACDRVISETGFDGLTTSFKYDASGRCISKTNPAGQAIRWELDPLGRMLKETAGDEAPTEFEYDKAGRICSARNAWSTIRFERDPAGRILKEEQNGFAIARTFGPMSEVLSLDSDAGAHFAYAYDANGLVARIDANGLGTYGFTRNGGDQVSELALPGGLRLESRFDSRTRLLRQTLGPVFPESAPASSPLLSRRYAYDESNMLRTIDDASWGKSGFTHDDAQRLIEYRSDSGTIRYHLNPTGDPVSCVQDGLTEIGMAYGPGGRLLRQGRWLFEYDAAGRLIGKAEEGSSAPGPSWAYSWDAKDRLRSVTTPSGETWEYEYDPFGRRIRKRGPEREIRFIWNQDVLLHEIEAGKPLRTWGFEPSTFKPLFSIVDGRLLSIVTDHLGTPSELFDPTGKTVWSVQFDPYGNPVRGKGRLEDCPLRLQGQYFDSESGLHYNRFRYYDPGTGRFISRDPILLAGGVAQYQYAPNPTRSCDPLGLCEETLYRTMSQEDFEELQRTGRMPATTETTTSPTQSFSEDYDGVLVEFKLKPGTIAELEAIGVRDDGKLTREKYPDMPIGGKGWNKEHARFKQEGDQINIALGKGDALDIFNDNIESFNAVRP
jgi:RHS repeat-associated protein